MQTKDTLVKIENLCYEVDGKVILSDVNAEIKDIVGRGQVVALLGPSGVGKTTLFRLLAGLIEPTSGKILINTADKGMHEVHSHEMGVVQQHYPLFEHRTILGNLLLVNKDEKKCIEMLDHFELKDHADKYPCQLSGGQKQRVAIIQQMLCSDRYILMDEPFSGLDLVNKCKVCKTIREMAAYHEENTIIIVTHDITDALKVADTIWMIGHPEGAISGARVIEEICLIDRGLSMNCCPNGDAKFYNLVKEISEKFVKLK